MFCYFSDIDTLLKNAKFCTKIRFWGKKKFIDPWSRPTTPACTLSLLYSYSIIMNKPMKRPVKSCLQNSARNLCVAVTWCKQSPVTSPVRTLVDAPALFFALNIKVAASCHVMLWHVCTRHTCSDTQISGWMLQTGFNRSFHRLSY